MDLVKIVNLNLSTDTPVKVVIVNMINLTNFKVKFKQRISFPYIPIQHELQNL